MVTTDTPQPNVFDSFGYDLDHLPYIGHLPYQEFYDNYAFLHHVDETCLASFKEDIGLNPMFDELLNDIFSEDSGEEYIDPIETIDFDEDLDDILNDINV